MHVERSDPEKTRIVIRREAPLPLVLGVPSIQGGLEFVNSLSKFEKKKKKKKKRQFSDKF